MGQTAVRHAMKPVGEPDAGNRHVRFDERGWETGHWRSLTAPRPSSTLLFSGNLGIDVGVRAKRCRQARFRLPGPRDRVRTKRCAKKWPGQARPRYAEKRSDTATSPAP